MKKPVPGTGTTCNRIDDKEFVKINFKARLGVTTKQWSKKDSILVITVRFLNVESNLFTGGFFLN